jgi:dethiobiotin synthetase
VKLFVTGIGTDVGKSVVSSVLIEAFGTDYWKPVQTGDKDTDFVSGLVSRKFTLHPPAYTFQTPASPHYAAQLEGVTVTKEKLLFPQTGNNLIVEGAGGLLVPLSNELLVVELIQQLQLPVILVSMHYLGSINHTLLSIEALKTRNIPLLGIVFNGNENVVSEKAILDFGNTTMLARINDEPEMNKAVVLKYAESFRNNDFIQFLFK